MLQEVSDADSSATAGNQKRAKLSSDRRAGSAKLDASVPSMTGSNPSSETYQDGTAKQAKTSGASKANRPKLPRPSGPPPQCPRCNADTSNTKFCYYNNYNINQPRYYCKACQRHWTDGGTLRKVETGAGKRNSRRQRGSGATSEAAAAAHNSKVARVQEPPHQNWPHENLIRGPPTLVPGMAPMLEATMPEHTSEANASFQEGSSFNAEKMLLEEDIDTTQAMADLDVIFANDRLDAILGNSQPPPAEDVSLGTMLGLEVLEDLANAYPADAELQQMDGTHRLDPAKVSPMPVTMNTSPGQVGSAIATAEGVPASLPVVSDLLPSPTVRSPAPTPPPQGVNVGAAFRNHGRPPSTGAAVAAAAAAAQRMRASQQQVAAAAAAAATNTRKPSPFQGDPPWDAQVAAGVHSAPPTRTPSEEATLATVADQSGYQSMPSDSHASGSWAEVPLQADQAATWNASGAAAASHGTRPATPQPNVHVAAGAAAAAAAVAGYPPGSGIATSAGMMAVPVNMHGSPYALPRTGYPQFGQAARPQRLHQGYYIPSQAMPGMRLQRPGHMQQTQMQMAPAGAYYVMPCNPEGRNAMPALAAKPPPGMAQAHMQSNQATPQRPAPTSSSSPTVSGAPDTGTGPVGCNPAGASPVGGSGGASPQQATASQLYAVEHNQQLMLRHQRIYNASASDKAGGGSPQAAPQAQPASMVAPTFVPVAAAPQHMANHMYMQQRDASATAQQDTNQPKQHGVQRTAQHAMPGAAGQQPGGASSSNRSAQSSQSNAVYVDFRQGAMVQPSAGQQFAGASPQQGLRGPVFCVAPGQWQHAGRPVYTLQPCYMPGGYMAGGPTMYAAGNPSLGGSTADQPSEDLEQRPLDSAQ